MLLQVDADAAEEHAIPADVGLVGPGRCVERNEGDFVSAREKLHGQRIVAVAAPAVHARGAGGYRQDLHLSLALGPHPQRELTPMPRLGFPCPRLGMAAGANLIHWRWGPTPPRTHAEAAPRISPSSPLHCR